MKKFFVLIGPVFLLLGSPIFSINAQVEEDEKILDSLEKERKASAVGALEVSRLADDLRKNSPLGSGSHESLNSAENMPPLTTPEGVAFFRKQFENNPIKQLPREKVKELILEKVKSAGIKRYLHRYPKIMDTLVDLVQDDKALPAAVGIFLRKKDLKTYASVCVILMLFSWILKRRLVKKGDSFTYRFVLGVFFNLAISSVSFTVFYRMFYSELSPAVKVIFR